MDLVRFLKIFAAVALVLGILTGLLEDGAQHADAVRQCYAVGWPYADWSFHGPTCHQYDIFGTRIEEPLALITPVAH